MEREDKSKAPAPRRIERDTVFKAVGIAMWVAMAVLLLVYRKALTAEGISALLPRNALAAAGILILAFAAKSISIIFSSAVLIVTSAIIFPLWFAFTVNFIGVVVMATIPYLIGVRGGVKELDRLCEKYPKVRVIRDNPIDNEFLFTFMLRINIVLSFDIGSIYLGAREISTLSYYLGSIAGMMPQMIIYTLFGVGISSQNFVLSAVSVGVKIVLSVISFVYFGIYAKNQRAGREKSVGKGEQP